MSFLKNVKSRRTAPTPNECRDFEKAAGAIQKDWEVFLNDTLLFAVISGYAKTIGVPMEYIFCLLMTCGLSMAGRSILKISPTWTEPNVLWFMIIGRKGKFAL